MREMKRPRMDQVKAMILYQQGKTDKEIAQKLAVSSYTVRDWRLKLQKLRKNR